MMERRSERNNTRRCMTDGTGRALSATNRRCDCCATRGDARGKDALMHRIQSIDFALTETVLYLDVYPHDRAAMNYFRRYRRELDRLVEEYERLYGPIKAGGDMSDARDGCQWKWSTEAWPWQMEE